MLSKEERAMLVNFLQETEKNLADELREITQEQWTYRPADGGWTPAECMSHILLAELALFDQVRQALREPAKRELSTKHQDAWLIGKVSDRGTKVKTPLPPKEVDRSPQEMLAEFLEVRKDIDTFLQDKRLPLRHHFGRSPYGPADAYQIFLVLSAHTMRHHHQIKEVIAEMAQAGEAKK